MSLKNSQLFKPTSLPLRRSGKPAVEAELYLPPKLSTVLRSIS
jgi:hypothetical protein